MKKFRAIPINTDDLPVEVLQGSGPAVRFKRMPRAFRRGHDDSLACRHRDCSCCPDCAKKYEEVIEVYGQHYWVADPRERATLRADMAKAEARSADRVDGYDRDDLGKSPDF